MRGGLDEHELYEHRQLGTIPPASVFH